METDAYIHCVSAFVKLAQSEYQLLMDIIPEHHQKKTFDSLIQVLPRPTLLPGPDQMPQQKLSLQKLEFGPDLSSVAFIIATTASGAPPRCRLPLRGMPSSPTPLREPLPPQGASSHLPAPL